MKRDPFPKPLNLAAGLWTCKELNRKNKSFESPHFWQASRQLASYRKSNRLPRAGFEECQMDMLIENRRRKGLPTELPANTPRVMSKQQLFRQRYNKPKKPCATCGKRSSARRASIAGAVRAVPAPSQPKARTVSL